MSRVPTADRRTDTLIEVGLLAGCSRKELAHIDRFTTRIEFPAGTALCRQGDAGSEFFVIIDGVAAVTKDGSQVANLGPGDFFGELALLDHGPRTATVTAVSALSALVLNRREFRSLLEAAPTVAARMLVAVASRLRGDTAAATLDEFVDPSSLRPARLSHIGIQTHDVEVVRDWYRNVLNAHVVVERLPAFCVMTYDGEHHRIAIAGLPGEKREKDRTNPEILHVAFAMDDVFLLLRNYERIRDLGITPEFTMNHGPTLSCYYRDPDGNLCELFVDRFATQEECTEWMSGPIFERTLGAGPAFDPEDLLASMRAGASASELLEYPVEAAMSGAFDGLLEEYAADLPGN
jgi:CRP-like cAMP-binding protein